MTPASFAPGSVSVGMIVSTIFSRRDCSVTLRLTKPTTVLTLAFGLEICVLALLSCEFALFSWEFALSSLVCIEEFWLLKRGISIEDAVTALAAAANPSLRNSRLVWSAIRTQIGPSLLLF